MKPKRHISVLSPGNSRCAKHSACFLPLTKGKEDCAQDSDTWPKVQTSRPESVRPDSSVHPDD